MGLDSPARDALHIGLDQIWTDYIMLGLHQNCVKGKAQPYQFLF